MTANLLRFTIGDLSIAIAGGRRYSISGGYRNFLDSITAIPESVDFSIYISPDNAPPSLSAKECVFRSGGAWALYRDGAGHTIVVSGRRELVIDRSFRHGRLYAEARNNGHPDSLPFSYPLDAVLVINLLPHSTGILVHACGVDDNGEGLVFLGSSGAGKSTVARLLQNEPGIRVFNDDKIIVREIDNIFYAYGTPWHGDVKAVHSGRARMRKLFFIEHSNGNYVKSLSPMDAAARMFVRCFPSFWDREGMDSTLLLIDRIVNNVQCYELGFVPDKSLIRFVRGLN